MKFLPLLLALAVSGPALAQDSTAPASAPAQPAPAELPPLPDPAPESESDLMRNQPGSRLKPAPQSEPSLVPPGIVRPADRPKSRSTLKPPATSAELEARIRYRQAHSRAANEPAIQALWEESRVARTDYNKRDALRRYYTLLFDRMLRFDKTVKPLVEERRRISLRKLDQTRIEPTDPLDEEHRQRRDDY